ncbi:S8 family peptidase [Oligoflexus tunisiensis]|uniref:S8 family peptidase n=1 Tax=Oligoflexus tunisiensis TaxID=708132 RepID=UPI000B23ED23|nr:S8 family peptidase [Oligoflexus tunisiensis]
MKSFVCVGAFVLSGSVFAATLIDKDSPNRIPNQYIIKLKSDSDRHEFTAKQFVRQEAQRLSQTYGVSVMRQYSKVMEGFAIKANDEQLAALMQDPAIERIEANKTMRTHAVQASATWGIDRVDSREGTDGVYTYSATGKGIHAYVIDTGIRATHTEFTGRVGEGFSALDDGRGAEDCHGHGTHVSATVAGTAYGVAKDVTIHGVRVMDCTGNGDDAGVIAGIEWVAENAIRPAVANMSLGGDVSVSVDDAVKAAVNSGVVFVAAAGNEFRDACLVSPAHVPEAITVGATNKSSWRALYSNFGPCVDIFAPGTNITSAWNRNDTATSTISGTSMAAPHVTGVIALYLEKNPSATPAEVDALMKENATPDIIIWPGAGSPNLMIYTNP